MVKKEINNWEIFFWSTYTSTELSYLSHHLKIIFQDLSSKNIFIINQEADSIMLDMIDSNDKKGTTNDLINSIIKKSIHKSELIDNVNKLKEHVWNPSDFNKLKSKIRDIKINQII